MEMLWIPRLIISVLCVFGNSEELDKKPSWWDNIFGDGIFRDEVDEDVSLAWQLKLVYHRVQSLPNQNISEYQC